MKYKKYEDVIVGIVCAIISIAGIILALNFADPAIKLAQTIDSKFFPLMVCAIMLAFSIMLIVSGFSKAKNAVEAPVQEEEYKPEYGRVIASVIAFTVFILLMDKIGFLIMSIIYLPVQMFILAPEEKQKLKNIILYIVIGVVASVIIYYGFIYGFQVMIPRGIL